MAVRSLLLPAAKALDAAGSRLGKAGGRPLPAGEVRLQGDVTFDWRLESFGGLRLDRLDGGLRETGGRGEEVEAGGGGDTVDECSGLEYISPPTVCKCIYVLFEKQ